MSRRVVITGIGPVTSMGIGKDTFFNNIINLNTNICVIPEAYQRKYKFKSRHYVPAPKLTLSEFKIAEPLERVMEEISKYSVVGAKLAILDAGFDIKENDKYLKIDGLGESAIIIGVGMSSLQTALHSYVAHMSGGESEFKYNRMSIPMLMPNSAAAWVAILFGIKGLSFTINASCASGSYAIGEAYNKIKDGYCETAIAGGVEALVEENGSVMRGFDMLSTLTKSEDGKPMPFSKNRSGFLLNEGAGCILVLEELDKAKSRGANIYAEIDGFTCNNDGYNIVQMEPSGKQIISLLERLIDGRKIQYLNSHGTGTILNDEIEAKAIQHIFGDIDKQPLINSTKGIFGHSIGASGAIEAAVTALSIKHSKIHGNMTQTPMENLNLPMKTIDKSIEYAITTSYGFGGHNAAILMKRYIDNE